MLELHGRYKQTRNAAWRALLDYQVARLPVSMSGVLDAAGIRAFSYQQHADLLNYLNLQDEAAQHAGMAVWYSGQWIAFYDAAMPTPRIRFTVAHEFGHIVMGHVIQAEGKATLFRSRSNVGDLNAPPRDPDERDADMFAARFLAPAVVLWALDVRTPEAIAQLTGMSHQAATYRAQRMELLRQRDMFMTHPLERALHRQFEGFIRSKRGG